ncbi:EmrB/QacA subfamily drug resistance transporter [Motilibacter rhizosphaerae]|uniref:EmrB/QacA subfamily drug resistance transporter n=1 Tax=Motilibacter rhizosphaerae TaxID=598652 RepID=A0A4V2F4A0_9ACTN|nr:MFS transporter [Motilibacter rhizosphaerae]RZS86877.1 EmrB/QacA subfamily drug resistance transporter [Motilibacter rhizosphaerae]
MRPTRPVLAVVCLALATVVSAVTSLNVAIPSLARDLHGTSSDLAWVVDAYSLVFAALLLPGGALGDRFGRRRVLAVGLSVYGLTALVAMTAGGFAELVALRAVLGLAAALIMPATLSTITSTFPEERRAQGVAAWTGVAGASAVLGLLTSGLLLEWFSWRSVFGLNVVLALLALVGTLRIVPESADPAAPPADLVGTLLSVAGLGVLVWALIEAPTNGWGSGSTLTGLAVGILVLAGFLVWELRMARPMLDPRLFARPAFAAGTLSVCVQFLAFFGFAFVFLQYLQIVRHDSALVAALSMLPLAVGLMPAARLAPRLVGLRGPGVVCVTGLGLAAVALGLLSRVDAGTSYAWVAAFLVPLGIGMGLAMTPATTAITAALPDEQQGVASAVNDLSRELGGALGIAILGSVLTSTYRSNLPQGLPAAARESAGVASQVGGRVAEAARTAFVDGLGATLLTGAGVVAVAAVVVGVLLGRAGERQRDAVDDAIVVTPAH